MVTEDETATPVQFNTEDPTTHYVNWEYVRVPLCPESETARKNEEMFLTRNELKDLREAMQAHGLHTKTKALSALHDILGLMGQWLDSKKENN